MSQPRLLIAVASAALTAGALVLPATTGSALTTSTPCTFTKTATTWTLQADCTTDETILVDAGITVDGKQHTITAVEPSSPDAFPGAIIASTPGTPGTPGTPTKMTVQKLNIDARQLDRTTGHPSDLVGILFDGAYGAVSHVSITGVAGDASDKGYGIKVDAAAVAPLTQKVRVSATTISGYQDAGISIAGDVGFNIFRTKVRNSATPGSGADGIVVQNLAHGGIKESTIALNEAQPGSTSSYGTGIRMLDATRVEIKRNIISGTTGDLGLSVENDMLNTKTATAVVGCTLFQRTDPDPTDTYGVGAARWTDGNKTKIVLSDSTFNGWNQETATLDGTSTLGAGPVSSKAGNCKPNAPTAVHATGGDGATKVTWQAGAEIGWAPVQAYTVSAKAAGHKAVKTTVGATRTSAMLTGLNNRLTYQVTVRAENNSGVTTASSRLYPTKLSLGAKPARVTKGQKSVLRGTLSSADPSASFARRPIVISARPVGGKWHTVSTVRTKRGGVYSLSVRTSKNTVYRATYAGRPGLASSHLTKVTVRR